MLKEAVPYDFGGIDIIDELTVAPPKKKESKKSKEEEKPESTTPSTMSGPEEPSLTNVVTAAEDFIKVLATVSTSQSSTADSDKGETQSSEKKKRKNTGKKRKTTKKQKGKGKGRKRKQKSDASVRIEEGAAVSPSGSKAEEVIALSNFINESHKYDQLSRNRYRVSDSEYELGRKEEPFNDFMKDEPAMDKETVTVTSTVQKKPAESDSDVLPTSTSMVIVNPHGDKNRRLRKERRKKKPQDTDTTDNLSAIYVPAIITTTPTAQAEQQSLGNETEKLPVLSAVSSPNVIPKVRKDRSKERKDREGKKKRRKVSSVSPIVAAGHENSSADNLNTIPPTGAPTVPSVPTAERQASHRLEVYGGKMAIHTALNSSFSVLKIQRSKERGLRNRRRKTVLPFSSENPPFHNSSENMLLIPTSSALNSLANSAAISRLTEKTETHSEWRLFTTAARSISTKQHKHAIRQQRKPRKKAVHAALSNRFSTPAQTDHSPITFTIMPSEVATTEELSLHRSGKLYMTTTAAPVMSPVQLSIERAKAQFTKKKKKKKAAQSRQQ